MFYMRRFLYGLVYGMPRDKITLIHDHNIAHFVYETRPVMCVFCIIGGINLSRSKFKLKDQSHLAFKMNRHNVAISVMKTCNVRAYYVNNPEFDLSIND